MLKVSTPRFWLETALRDFDAFLLDHASCERKASAVGMSFVVRYPDRDGLIEPMIQFAREELEHFHQVYRLVEKRGLRLGQDEEDEYVNLLMKHVRSGRNERFLDRLLVSSVIEARGHERLAMVAQHFSNPSVGDLPLARFYDRLARAEGHHKDLFLELALKFFPDDEVMSRLETFLFIEAEAITSVPYRSALH